MRLLSAVPQPGSAMATPILRLPGPLDERDRLIYSTGQINRLIENIAMAADKRQGFDESAASFEHRQAGGTQAREVQSSVAKTHFSQLLDDVERGETIVILRHGRPIARIVPDPEGRRQQIGEAIDNIRKLAKERQE